MLCRTGGEYVHEVKALEFPYEKDSFSIHDQRPDRWFYYHSKDIQTPYILLVWKLLELSRMF
jgi:hypothetical protein